MKRSFDGAKRRAGYRVALLGGVSALVLGAAVAGRVLAADVTVDTSGTPPSVTTTGQLTLPSSLTNTAPVDVSVAGSLLGASLAAGPDGGLTVSTAANLLPATATGNTFAGKIDAALLDSLGDGAALASVASNVSTTSPAATVVASATDNAVTVDVTDLLSGAVTVSANAISANATGNDSTSLVAGTVPNGYASGTGAVSSFDLGIGAITTGNTASIAVTTLEQNIFAGQLAGSGAFAVDNAVTLDIAPSAGALADQAVTASVSVAGNSVSASYAGNTASSGVSLATGGNPAFTGSISVANLQANVDDGPSPGPSAVNAGTLIAGSVTHGASGVEEVLSGGSLSVLGNSVTAAAAGNRATGSGSAAGNQIALADGLSFFGPATDAHSTISYSPFGLQVDASGGLSVANVQSNGDGYFGNAAPVGSLTTDAVVSGAADHLDAASMSVSSNSIGATSAANTASNAILAPGTGNAVTATLAGELGLAALTNLQDNAAGSTSTATVDGNTIEALVGYGGGQRLDAGSAVDSAVAMRGDSISATAFGNQVANAVALAANDVSAINSGPPGVSLYRNAGGNGDIYADVFAGVALASVQTNHAGADVSAVNVDSTIQLLATEVGSALSGDSFTINGANTYAAEALAVGNNAVNSATVRATTLAVTAGVLNLQTADATSSASLVDPLILIGAGGDFAPVEASTLSVVSNTLRAVAYGNSSANELAGIATTMSIPSDALATASVISTDLAAPGGLVFDYTTAPEVNAMYALVNDQAAAADVNASVTQGSDAPIQIDVGAAGMAGSAAFVDANAVVAGAYGNQTSNSLSLAATTLQVSGGYGGSYTPAAAVVNLQTVADGVQIGALLDGPVGGALFQTTVGGDADGSTLSVSGNVAQALAYGNWANTNTLTVTGTTVNDVNVAPLGALSTSPSSIMSADVAFLVQNAQQGGTGLISATQPGNGDAGALIDVAGSVVGSALQMGAAASGGSAGAAGNQFLATAYDNSAVNNLGITATSLAASAGIQSLQNSEATVEALLGTASPVTQLITVGGDIVDSALEIHGTQINGTAIGNNLANTMAVAANTVTGGSGITSPGSQVAIDGSLTAAADYMISNDQRFTGLSGGAYAEVASQHGFQAAGDVSGSRFTVTGVTQQAAAEGNLSTNSLSLTMTNGGVISPAPTGAPTATVLSRQTGSAPVVSDSSLDIFAPAVGDSSRITLSGNTNTALAVMNDVVNLLVVSSTNAGSGSATGNPAIPPNATATVNALTTGVTVTADFSLLNQQTAGEAVVTATATTNIHNGDSIKLATAGMSNGSADMSNNTTASEADGNRATNGLSVTAGSTVASTAAVVNSQSSSATVTSTATQNVTFSLNGGDGGGGGTAPALNNSSVNISGNTTTATAHGNYANNVLNAAPGASYGTSNASGANATNGPGPTTASASASYVVLNDQSNTGPVSATATAEYTTNLNGNNTVPGTMNNSGVTMYGNTVMASAYGNYANNTVVLSGLSSSGTTTSINNVQYNSGPVSATVNMNQSNTVGGGMVNSMFVANSGNSVQAFACGNCAVNTVTSR